jgi:hypothetical protein
MSDGEREAQSYREMPARICKRAELGWSRKRRRGLGRRACWAAANLGNGGFGEDEWEREERDCSTRQSEDAKGRGARRVRAVSSVAGLIGGGVAEWCNDRFIGLLPRSL